MNLSGIIVKINKDLGYGFIDCTKIKEVFFSTETKFENTEFNNLAVGIKVTIQIIETERGMFAESLSLTSL